MTDNNILSEIDENELTVELELDDNTKVTCVVITILEVNSKDYIVLMPVNDEGESEDGNVWFYRYYENLDKPEEEPELGHIDNDEEYEMVADAFDEYLDEQEFDELIEELDHEED